MGLKGLKMARSEINSLHFNIFFENSACQLFFIPSGDMLHARVSSGC